MTLEFLDHGHDTVVPPHPQVVALRDVVREDHPGAGADPGQDSQQDAALQRLCLVDDDERVMQ
jgi:hypothetical protein